MNRFPGSVLRLVSALFILLLAMGGATPLASAAGGSAAQVSSSVQHDVSPPLSTLKSKPRQRPARERDNLKLPALPQAPAASRLAAAIQNTPARATAPATAVNFEGIGQGFRGPQGTYNVNEAPSDSNGAVGPNNYVETVNTDFAVFNKSGGVLYGPVALNTVWTGFGGNCEADNDGDPSVVYDRQAGRWVVMQFAITNANPFLLCVAVSTSGDPAGSYNRYSFVYGSFPDYPKLGVWPDGYYVTTNQFDSTGSSFLGGEVAALDRTSMLAGAGSVNMQQISVGSSYGGLLPATVDSAAPPPAGSPNYVVALGDSADLAAWTFHVDWNNSGNTVLSGPTMIPVASFAEACGGGTCIPQSATRQQLDSLADRLMYRLAYRNFGDHESLVVNHSVTVGSSVGLRWYELRVGTGYSLSLYQQGTYAPDSSDRWMGSAAMDQSGDIALGFSVSSSGMHPQIRYTGRLASDPLGQMPQGEGTIINGNGSQMGYNLSRWGDYSSMAVDPSDDCTFWYTQQYLANNGAFNWHTRVGAFKFPSCGGAPPPNDFSISVNPTSGSIPAGSSGTATISTAVTSGSAQTVALSTSTLPAGVAAGFNSTPVTAGGSSTLTLTVDPSTTTGNYPFTIIGTEGSITHSASYTLTVTAPVSNDFSISLNPTSLSLVQGNSGSTTVSTAVMSGTAQSVSLSISGLPTNATATFNPTTPITAGGSATLSVTADAQTPTGNYTLTVTGTEGSMTHSASLSLTVTAPVPNDFSIGVDPTSLSIAQNASGQATVSTAVTSGAAQTVDLSASGVPTGANANLNPTSVTSGNSSTLTIKAGSATPGIYPITITGTGTSATHATSLTLTVTAAPSQVIVNGGFETGDLSGWTTVRGTTGVTTAAHHTGGYSAQLGATGATQGDSTINQSFTAPSGTSTLTLSYLVHCADTVNRDWATVTLVDHSAFRTATILPRTCTNNGAWQQVTASVIPGHRYTLNLTSHDNNHAADPTYTQYDDVAVQ